MKIYSNPIIPIYQAFGGTDQHEHLLISQLFILMKSGIQGVRSSVGSDQCAKIFVWNPLPAVQSSVWQRHSWHGLLLVAPYLNKGNHDVVVIDRGSPPWSPWGPRSGRPHELSRPPPFFKEVLHNLLLPSSTSVWNQRSPLIQWHRFMNTCTECSVSL